MVDHGDDDEKDYGWIVIASALDAENSPGGHDAGALGPNHTNCAVRCAPAAHLAIGSIGVLGSSFAWLKSAQRSSCELCSFRIVTLRESRDVVTQRP